MLLTKQYKIVKVKAALKLPERNYGKNLMGWITPDNSYLDIYDNGGSHLDVLKKFKVLTSDEYNTENYIKALSLGWVRVFQNGRNVNCELHYSRIYAVKNVLQELIDPVWIVSVHFYLYDSNGNFTREKEFGVVDGVID